MHECCFLLIILFKNFVYIASLNFGAMQREINERIIKTPFDVLSNGTGV